MTLKHENKRPHLVHVVTVESVPGVAVGTRAALDTICCLDAHILTETDQRGTPCFHHLSTTQTF